MVKRVTADILAYRRGDIFKVRRRDGMGRLYVAWLFVQQICLSSCVFSLQVFIMAKEPKKLALFPLLQTAKRLLVISYKVIRKVTVSFTPCPLFQWYLQSKKYLLHLSTV
jgi:hypothetical protein